MLSSFRSHCRLTEFVIVVLIDISLLMLQNYMDRKASKMETENSEDEKAKSDANKENFNKLLDIVEQKREERKYKPGSYARISSLLLCQSKTLLKCLIDRHVFHNALFTTLTMIFIINRMLRSLIFVL